MGLPDYHSGKEMFTSYYRDVDTITLIGADTHTIFEHEGSGEIVHASFEITRVTQYVQNDNKVALWLDEVNISEKLVSDLQSNNVEPAGAIFLPTLYYYNNAMFFSLVRGLSFHSKIKVTWYSDAVGDLSCKSRVALGIY